MKIEIPDGASAIQANRCVDREHVSGHRVLPDLTQVQSGTRQEWQGHNQNYHTTFSGHAPAVDRVLDPLVIGFERNPRVALYGHPMSEEHYDLVARGHLERLKLAQAYYRENPQAAEKAEGKADCCILL